jgi:hypothetical protein
MILLSRLYSLPNLKETKMSLAKNLGLFVAGCVVAGVTSSFAKKHDFTIRAKQADAPNNAVSTKDTATTVAITAVSVVGTALAGYGASSFIKAVLEDKS